MATEALRRSAPADAAGATAPVLEPGRLDAIARRYGAPPLAIELEGLRKVYAGSRRQPPKEALKGIGLAVPRGAIFGLLGALLVLASKARLNSQWLVQNLVLGVVITVVGWRYISWQGHLGGLLGGALAAAIIAYAPASRRALVQWVGLGLLLAVLLGLALVQDVALS